MSTVTDIVEKNPLEKRVVEVRKELPPELVELWRELETLKMIEKRNKEAQEEIRARIAAFLGDDTVGTIDGKPTVKYVATGAVAEKRLEQEYPQTYAAYLVEVVKLKLDVEAFRRDWPDLFKEFQTKRVQPVGSRTL